MNLATQFEEADMPEDKLISYKIEQLQNAVHQLQAEIKKISEWQVRREGEATVAMKLVATVSAVVASASTAFIGKITSIW